MYTVWGKYQFQSYCRCIDDSIPGSEASSCSNLLQGGHLRFSNHALDLPSSLSTLLGGFTTWVQTALACSFCSASILLVITTLQSQVKFDNRPLAQDTLLANKCMQMYTHSFHQDHMSISGGEDRARKQDFMQVSLKACVCLHVAGFAWYQGVVGELSKKSVVLSSRPCLVKDCQYDERDITIIAHRAYAHAQLEGQHPKQTATKALTEHCR